jgi:CRISPR/Cas system-associated exonuclease Cas4 (RecB family)
MIAAVRRRLDGDGRQENDDVAVSLVESEGGVSKLWIQPQPEPRPLQVPKRPLSPTSLQTYTVCARKYFYAKVLKVEEEETIYLTYGSLFHSLLQQICEDNRTYGELVKVINSDRLDQYINAVVQGERGLVADALVDQVTRHHLKESARRFLELDAGRVDDFCIEATEKLMKFSYKDQRFVGILDRLDRSSGHETVTLDYKTGAGSVPKTGKTIRKRILPECEHPEQRLWQVPFYCRAVGDLKAQYPKSFLYYVVDPNKDHFVAGVVIGDEDTRQSPNAVFEDKVQSKLGHLTPEELEMCLDEAAAFASEMFAERSGFPKTEEDQRCRNCPYKRVCERDS